MFTYSNRLQPALQSIKNLKPTKPITTCCFVLSPEIVMPDAYICGRLRRTKITCKASDAAAYIELFGSFTRDCHARRRIYQSEDVQRITLNASCMMISDVRTKQLDIFCCVTGFTGDFLSFIDMELIRFFHGVLQLFYYVFGLSPAPTRYIILLLWCDIAYLC